MEDIFLFAFGLFAMGLPIFAKMLYVFYWIGTLVLSLLISKIRFSVTKESEEWSRKKKCFLLLFVFNLPPAAVPAYLFTQWGIMCLAQEDYMMHNTFETPSEYFHPDGFPSFVSDYRGDFRLPIEGLDLSLVDNSNKIKRSITKKNIVVKVDSTKSPVFEYSMLIFRPSDFPDISYIYRDISSIGCGYNSSNRTKRKYKDIMKKTFIKKRHE